MTRIVSDPRHHDPLVVVRGHNRRRLFDDWYMGDWMLNTPEGDTPERDDQPQQTIDLLKASEEARFCYALFETLSAMR